MRRNVIVIGASAGGVEALCAVVATLPIDLAAAVLVVLHIPSDGHSVLPAILGRAGPLPARHPESGDLMRQGVIYVAPPDHHLVIDDKRILLTHGPREHGHRPAIDVLFRSAASSAGARVVAVVLSGVLDDGTAGLAAVALGGGVTAVQDPADAVYPDMPKSAMAHVHIDHVAAAAQLGELLGGLCA